MSSARDERRKKRARASSGHGHFILPSDEYLKGAKLGEGSYGTVHVATGPDGVEVALKTPDKDAQGDKDSQQGISHSCLREVVLLRALSPHPHIVALHGVLIDNGQLICVLGRATRDLTRYMRARPRPTLEAPTALDVLRQVALGIEHCHAHSVVHRDVKPSNILIDERPGVAALHARLCDLGTALRVAPGRTNTLVGSLPYEAPEMLLGDDTYGTAVDVWSLGTLFCEMRLPVDSTFFVRERTCTERVGMLARVAAAVGMPTDVSWPGVSALPNFAAFAEATRTSRPHRGRLRALLAPSLGAREIELLESMLLVLDPRRRAPGAAVSRRLAELCGRFDAPPLPPSPPPPPPPPPPIPRAARARVASSLLEGHAEVTARMRGIVVGWLVEAHRNFRLEQRTLHLAVALLDEYLRRDRRLPKRRLQLLGIGASHVAAKMVERDAVDVGDWVYISAMSVSADEVREIEGEIVRVLDAELDPPILPACLEPALEALQPAERTFARYLADITLLDGRAADFPPAALAQACASLAAGAPVVHDGCVSLLRALHALAAACTTNDGQFEYIRKKYAADVCFDRTLGAPSAVQ